MAGQVKVAVVSGAISTSPTGSADFIKSGFGTPKACIVILCFDPVDDVNVAIQSNASIGFSDFTNHRCITHQDEDASAKVDSDASKSATKAYKILRPVGSVDIEGTASTIANGVRLTNTLNVRGIAPFAAVIMFGGADLQVSIDSISLSNGVDLTALTTTGIPQDLVFFIGSDVGGEDTINSGINNSFGVADISNDQATIVNRCMAWASDHNNNDGTPFSVIRNNRALTMITEAGALDWGIELTAATTTSYTITTRDVSPGASMEVYALALNLDDRGSKIGSVDSPTSGTSWTPSVALGFTPQHVGLGLTHARVEGTIEGDADAGGLGLSFNTGSGEEACHSWYNEDLAATTNTNNLFRSRAIDFRDHDVSTVIHDHSHSSFNSGDWTYTINTENETVARKWFYWAIEEETAGETPVSQTAISNYEALEGVPQTELSPFEALIDLAPVVIPVYEALEEALQTNVPPFEALEGLSLVIISPFEAAGTIIKSLLKNYEAGIDLINSELSPFEAGIDVVQADASVFEALEGVETTDVSLYEAAGTIIKALTKNMESLLDLSASEISAFEAGEGVLKLAVSHLEALEGVKAAIISQYAAAGSIVSTVASPYEAQVGIVVTNGGVFESLILLTPTGAGNFESLAGVLASAIKNFESLQNVIQITVSPYEARQGGVAGKAIIITIQQTLDSPNPIKRTLNYFTILTRKLEGD